MTVDALTGPTVECARSWLLFAHRWASLGRLTSTYGRIPLTTVVRDFDALDLGHAVLLMNWDGERGPSVDMA